MSVRMIFGQRRRQWTSIKMVNLSNNVTSSLLGSIHFKVHVQGFGQISKRVTEHKAGRRCDNMN